MRSIKIIALIILALYAIIMPSLVTLLWLAIAIIYVVGSAFYIKRASTKITIALQSDEGVVLVVTSTNKLPIYKAILRYELKHVYTGQVVAHDVVISLRAKERYEHIVRDMPKWYGLVTCTIKDIKIVDMLQITSHRIAINTVHEHCVLPSLPSINEAISTAMYRAEQEHTVANTQLADGTHFREIKPYEPGDAVKMIHWKLSSKLDDLYVKRWEEDVEEKLIVSIMTLNIANDAERYNNLIEKLYGYLHTAIQHNKAVTLLLYTEGWQHTEMRYDFQVAEAVKRVMYMTADELTTHSQALQQYNAAVLVVQAEGGAA